MLTVSLLAKSFGPTPVLNDISLDLPTGQVLAVLGRSGCGKTTLLKILAGLETPDRGDVRMDGQSVLSVPPERRQVVYLYQEPLLFPHLNVFENVAFGLRIRHVDAATIDQQVDAMLNDLELSDQARKQPNQLSGGQRQRVSFGRALIIRPRLLLLDEPFGNLDAQTRATMQELFGRVAKQYAMTALFVTHDTREALTIGTRFGYLDRGVMTTYDSVADFVADPRTGVHTELAFWESVQTRAV
ncbi:ABC transporter ATP-binding protein [Spirosoma utsteinense]|uniref:Putrescine transport system ATP-binding protein n=1 Tax=Spirosoma utsteinense TaxID=2585773 RepID=A0ABR6W896_9BACT|nr:ABC transporter ATP-binding protein [Spirosoma utsteinense]MBC3784117.1 putrescine transport system ATP-binding protein [Spirosoma utsteinense]MBC3792794.1 putrescine transport system ATP-binding protein [Spirosoma utsteinense]